MELDMLAPDRYSESHEDPIRFYTLPLLGWLYRDRVARCVSMLPQGKRVLEIGFGNGVSFLPLGARFDEVHGVDLHDRCQEVARSFSGTGVRPHLRQGSVLQLPYEDDSFDAALAISIHEHLQIHEQPEAFAEIQRVLRPGGCYVVGVPGLNMMMAAAFSLTGYPLREYHFTSERQVLEAMRDRFEIDVARASPPRWARLWTLYLYIRGIAKRVFEKRIQKPSRDREGAFLDPKPRSLPYGRGSDKPPHTRSNVTSGQE